MKKYLLFSFTLTAINFSIQAQQLPNASFETWAGSGNNEKPDDWNQLNASLPASVAVFVPKTCHKTTPAHSGTYCVKLETVDVTFQGATNGILTTGNIITTPPYGIDGGLVYPYRPDSLVGWFQSDPETGDFGTIEITLLDASLDTVGRGKFYTPSTPVTSWTRFAVAVDYFLSGTPDKAIALASSSDGFSAVVGSLLWVDDLELIFNPVSVDENVLNNIRIYSHGKKIFANLLEQQFQNPLLSIYSIDGKLILTKSLQNNSINEIKTDYTNGIYIYSITDNQNSISGKIALH